MTIGAGLGPPNHQAESFRSGFCALVGRPNVGKSTLANALVGQTVAITSPAPGTTRRRIRGIVHGDDHQIVLVDTPGLHRPRTPLGERLNRAVADALNDVDLALVCLPAGQMIGPGDRFLLDALPPGLERVAVVTKIDTVKTAALFAKLAEVNDLADWNQVVPVSALHGQGLQELRQVLVALMPPGPPWYHLDEVTDQTPEHQIAELIRQAALDGARLELPHSLAVVVEELDLPRIEASLLVERDSQKPIVIGRKGENLKRIGSTARPLIERLVGQSVYLRIQVKVAKNWQRDPKALDRMGF
jgi:GTP-binding protein Era